MLTYEYICLFVRNDIDKRVGEWKRRESTTTNNLFTDYNHELCERYSATKNQRVKERTSQRERETYMYKRHIQPQIIRVIMWN